MSKLHAAAARRAKQVQVYQRVPRRFWGAHAPRVLFSAPRRKLRERSFRLTTMNHCGARSEEPFGEAPNGAREARALPRVLTNAATRLRLRISRPPAAWRVRGPVAAIRCAPPRPRARTQTGHERLSVVRAIGCCLGAGNRGVFVAAPPPRFYGHRAEDRAGLDSRSRRRRVLAPPHRRALSFFHSLAELRGSHYAARRKWPAGPGLLRDRWRP
jgi:hypothetical protein